MRKTKDIHELKEQELNDRRHDIESEAIKNFLYVNEEITVSTSIIARHSAVKEKEVDLQINKRLL